MKRGILIISIILTLSLISFVDAQANSNYSLNINGENYAIELVSADDNSAIFRVNSNTRQITYEQSSPYTFPQSQGYQKIGGLDVILTYANENTAIGSINVSALIGIKQNFYIDSDNPESKKNLSINGENYAIELLSADDNSAIFRVNSNTRQITYEQSSPYTFPQSQGYQKIGGLDVILTYANENTAIGSINVSAFFFIEQNFYIGSTCSDECINDERICEANGYKICGNYDTDECLEWSDVTDCDSGKTCSNGVCVDVPIPTPTCSNECNVSEEKTCFNISYYLVCGSYDEDSCLEWSDVILCPMGPTGRICSEGECVGFPNPNPEPVKECEPVGLRKTDKYCSINNVWKNQKANSISCENNFECKSNNCLDSVCGGKKYPEYVTYLIIAGVIIIIIGIVLVIRKAMH